MLPVTWEIRDAAGKLTGDTTQSTLQGTGSKEVTVPLNGIKGSWKVTLRENITGKSASAVFIVE